MKGVMAKENQGFRLDEKKHRKTPDGVDCQAGF